MTKRRSIMRGSGGRVEKDGLVDDKLSCVASVETSAGQMARVKDYEHGLPHMGEWSRFLLLAMPIPQILVENTEIA